MSKVVMAGSVLSAALFAAVALNNPRPENEICARNGDGALVSSTDGINFVHLNTQIGDDNLDAADWVEGKAGWTGKPICSSRDAEFQMPLKDLPQGARIAPREREFDI